jgi:hypothetical protein
MGLSNTFKNSAKLIADIFADLQIDVTYHQMGTVTYDPSEGEDVESGGTDYDISIILDVYKTSEIDNTIVQSYDRRVLIPSLDIELTPAIGDYILHDSVKWIVRNVKTDPASALWELQVRGSINA